MTGSFRHFALMAACGFLFPWVWLSEQRQRRQQQLVKAVADTIPVRPRVAVWIFPRGVRNELGWRVRAHCAEEAAEIISQSPCFGFHVSP